MDPYGIRDTESLPTLLVSNGYSARLSGLAVRKPLLRLTEKTVTVKVRAVLCEEYGDSEVTVACEAKRWKDRWSGSCHIANKQLSYEVR